MPLLSNKLYILNKIRKEKKDDDSLLCHSLTNEICENQDELNRKTFLYNQKIWTCRITGQINLTFKEALKSEQGCTKMLKNSFKKCFEAVVLQFVHHSKESLDTLIHKAWTQIHQEFCVNEPVTIKLTTPKEIIIKGIVVKVDRSKSNDDKDQDSPIKLNSDASSSDKENIKKKIIPIKKNYFYSVKINMEEMEKLVKDIPAETIERTLRPPSKDQIRMFIRSHAMRHSGKQNNPWVVDEDLVKKYRLPVLEPEYVMDKAKMRELSQATELQMYHKIRDENRSDAACVDLTKSDNEDEKTHVNTSRNETGKRKLKQATLFDVHTSTTTTPNHTRTTSAIRSPLASPTRSLPHLAQRLLKMMKDTPNDQAVKQLIFKCSQLFSFTQISRFPDLIRSPIKARKEKFEEKKKLDAMSPEDREAFLAKRRNELRQQLRERRREENAKLEDSDLTNSKPIPEASPVLMEYEMMSQDQWARIVSVSEFVRCYRRLLLAPVSTGIGNVSPGGDEGAGLAKLGSMDGGAIRVDELCRYVAGSNDCDWAGFSELVCVLLKTLLQDNGLRNRREMGLPMSELPVTACTAGELLRLVLPLGNVAATNGGITAKPDSNTAGHEGGADNEIEMEADMDNMENGEDSEAFINTYNNNKIAGPICEKLEHQELHQLPLEDKITILELLQSRILELDVVSSFIDEYQREVCEAYKRRIVDTKEFNDKLKVVRQNKQNMSRVLAASVSVIDGSAMDTNGADEEASQVSRRRQSIEQKQKESEEKERRIEKERQYQKLEKEEAHYKRSLEQCQRSYATAILDAKQLMRVQPLGSDRRFRRYWHFVTAPGALYVETEETAEQVSAIGDTHEQQSVITSWGRYISMESIAELIDSLSDKGVRESSLRSEIESIVPKLREEIESALFHDTKQISVTSKSPKESFLVLGFKQELLETELSIRQGSLGGVEDYSEWKKCLLNASTIEEMKQALVAVFLGVHERFWNAPLKSSNGRNEFLTSVEQAITQGRLNVLQSFLDACVCWSKSAKDDKCRVCRKSSDENAMLLCDSCNHAFHTFCLRPPLHGVPEGEWFCPHCRPASRAKDESGLAMSTTVTNGNSLGVKQRSKRGTQELPSCNVCHAPNNGGEQLAKCSACARYWHAQCHEPALRQIRRTNWHCSHCRMDEAVTRPTGGRRPRSSLQQQSIDNNESDGSDDDDNDDADNKSHSDESQTPLKPQHNKKGDQQIKNGAVAGRKRKIVSQDDEDEPEQKQSSPSKPRGRPGRKPSKLSKPAMKSVSSEDESDLDEPPTSLGRGRGRQNIKRNSSVLDRSSSPIATAAKKARTSLTTPTPEKIDKACKTMLKHLLNHKSSWPFREPVDVKEVPDYYEIVTEPMDLSTMMDKSSLGQYRSGSHSLRQFLDDIGRVFYNAELYNMPDSKIVALASSLEQFFKTLYEKYNFGVEYSRPVSTSD